MKMNIVLYLVQYINWTLHTLSLLNKLNNKRINKNHPPGSFFKPTVHRLKQNLRNLERVPWQNFFFFNLFLIYEDRRENNLDQTRPPKLFLPLASRSFRNV